jgi:hypothetical protein
MNTFESSRTNRRQFVEPEIKSGKWGIEPHPPEAEQTNGSSLPGDQNLSTLYRIKKNCQPISGRDI